MANVFSLPKYRKENYKKIFIKSSSSPTLDLYPNITR